MRKLVIFGVALGLLLILGALRFNNLRQSRAEILRESEARAANLTQLLTEYLSEIFASGDAALRQIALHSERIGGPGAPDGQWTPTLLSARSGLSGIGAISIVDRNIVIRHSTRSDIIGQPRGGQDFIAKQLLAGADGLLIGEPFRSPVVNQYLIPIGRRLVDGEGNTTGAVVASFLPQDLRRFFQTISVGEHGTVWVFHSGGRLVVREPSAEDPVGTAVEHNALFAAATGDVAEGIVRGPVTEGQAPAISAFRHVPDLPLIAAVSLDQSEALLSWRAELQSFSATYAIISVVLIGVLFVLSRQIDAKTKAEHELQLARQAEAERLRQTNEQLGVLLEREQAARREAEAASALKDQFVMTVSHELRTPLTAIAGWARMLVDGMVSEDKREGALHTIERNAQAQKRLIEDLLDINGIMAGKLRLDVRPIVVADVMRMAVEAIAPAAAAKGISIATHVDENAGTIRADPERLQQIVWNLLSNAVKFTPQGGAVSLSVVRADRALHITVTDSGMGITADLLPHVFERFRQGHGSSRKQGGLGLGLAIVRNLVELHGGTVSAHSEGEGRGATFDVVIPAA